MSNSILMGKFAIRNISRGERRTDLNSNSKVFRQEFQPTNIRKLCFKRYANLLIRALTRMLMSRDLVQAFSSLLPKNKDSLYTL